MNELTDELKKDGFDISRSGVYLRLLPKRINSIEGKKHVNTAPVKLVRPENNLHRQHIDGKFCIANIKYLEELSSFLGPNEVCFISQDDKARVPIGMTAAHLQAPLVMHLEYRVQLPDHDWVVAGQHKLIPSVYAGIIINDSIGFSGPTYVMLQYVQLNTILQLL